MADGFRPKRVAEGIRASLATAISTQLADPLLSSLVVTRVEVSPDLASAYIYVRLMIDGERARTRAVAVRRLNAAAARLKRGLSATLRMKRLPQLKFEYDHAPDQRARVDELIDEIQREQSMGTTIEQAGPEPESHASDSVEDGVSADAAEDKHDGSSR